MKKRKFEITEHNLVKFAVDTYKTHGNLAYGIYTRDMIQLINDCYPLTKDDFDNFNKRAKILRARLSQGIGAASKRGKGEIIMFYARRMSAALDLSMSVREAQEVIKGAAGRSVAKSRLSGLFGNRDGSDRYSPFFTDSEYKKKVLEHPLVVDLSIKIAEFDDQKPKLSNAESSKIKAAIMKFA